MWIFYLYIVAVVYYYCYDPDAWLCTWLCVNLSLVFFSLLILLIFNIFFIHSQIQRKKISCHFTVSRCLWFHFIPFQSILIHSHHLYIFIHFISFGWVDDMIFVYILIRSKYVVKCNWYGCVRLEMIFWYTIYWLWSIILYQAENKCSQNTQITCECKKYLVCHWCIRS